MGEDCLACDSSSGGERSLGSSGLGPSMEAKEVKTRVTKVDFEDLARLVAKHIFFTPLWNAC